MVFYFDFFVNINLKNLINFMNNFLILFFHQLIFQLFDNIKLNLQMIYIKKDTLIKLILMLLLLMTICQH